MEAAGHAPAGPGPDAPEALTSPLPPSRPTTAFPGSLAISVLLHGAALALLMQLSAPPLPPLAAIIPVSLVSLPGGGGGPKGESEIVGPPPGLPAVATAAAPPVAPAPQPTKAAKAPKPVARVTKPAPAPPPAAAPAPEVADASSGSGTVGAAGTATSGGGGSGDGGGDGSGGDGSGGARVAYGQNPLPPYPIVARRLGMEGVVLLDVLVAPDGTAADVRLARSSGHQQLDDSAVRTVRERWRFIPARRDGAAVESRVTVPIRFRLSDADAAG